jgi:hypothetical protein
MVKEAIIPQFASNDSQYLALNSLGLDNPLKQCYYQCRSYFHIGSLNQAGQY